jgi:hypothetical protein
LINSVAASVTCKATKPLTILGRNNTSFAFKKIGKTAAFMM